MPKLVQLHNHTQFSLLDGASKIDALVQKAVQDEMPAIGISDHGNMYGVPKFVLTCRKHGIQPVVGSELYITRGSRHEKRRAPRKEGDFQAESSTYHQILFAKNETGYKNLMKLTSLGFTEGYYYKPRIDHELLQKYHHGLIATTCCLASEVHQALLFRNEAEARKRFEWYLELFGEDYYIELQRHGLQAQDQNNQVLLRWAREYNVPVIATNDVHYVDEPDSEAHDLLLALQTAADLNDENRFRFTYDTDRSRLNPNFYFKTSAEMSELFHDVPHALENTVALAEKCHFAPEFNGELILPVYQIPEGFEDMDAYLAHLSWEGVREKYGEITADIQERVEHELAIIRQMGYAGYFLIVSEFTREARKRGVYVGPGRGSAAGSVVAYALGIIDIDPIKYSLFFERFLNPERVSPPDIDIDFDDEGREEVINFVVEKYGKQSVAQIITYGTMGPKTALRDVGRVMKIPLQKVDEIAKYVPERPDMSFELAFDPAHNPDHARDLVKARDEDPDENIRRMLRYAQTLEGTPRQVGIHAAGVIIAPGEVTDYVPVAINNTRDNTVITQFNGPMAEEAGLLKMDFLGLKTLSIIKTTLRNVKHTYEVEIDPDNIPLDDEATFKLYQAGNTVATFQFESEGMRKHLRSLKPTSLEDLIAMNALYRPGPMDNIPSFIRRKHGREAIQYPHPLLEPILENTYGIMVYQEQIMEAAKVLAGYTLGGADLLRRAMGKKKVEVMEQERVKFIEGARQHNAIPEDQANQIFELMAKFAGYGFNKSHAAAYSVLAFRTGYLKAHYPDAYMAAVLSHNLNDISKITFFIEECRTMGLQVLPPCINESRYDFSVSEPGKIRFGLGGIKGLGSNLAQGIIAERDENGPYASLFDMTARVESQLQNRRSLECLAKAGAFDNCMAGRNVHRAQYFHRLSTNDDRTALDLAVAYGQKMEELANTSQIDMFGSGAEDSGAGSLPEPALPEAEAFSILDQLNYEREVIGFYLSGHPLDRYEEEIGTRITCTLDELEQHKGKKNLTVAGIVTEARERITKGGTPFGNFTVEDKKGKLSFVLFNKDYGNWSGHLKVNNRLLLKGSYTTSKRNPSECEFRIKDVIYLEEVLEKHTRAIDIVIGLHALDSTLIEELWQLLQQYPGNCQVNFVVEKPETEHRVFLHSRNTRVEPNQELRTELKARNLKLALHAG